ncbi:MAG: hypothetical protein HY761_03425 [Candidatus Omnitrophica bacterium]|nr:hypothetical protein [Candidatus Omnitrophota bacterium]
MRTTINLEKEELTHLLTTTHLKNKSKAVSIAIEEFLRRERLKKIDLLRGNFSFDEKILEARHYAR